MKGTTMSIPPNTLVNGDEVRTHDMITIGGAHHFVTDVDPHIGDNTRLTLLYVDAITHETKTNTLIVKNDMRFYIARE